MSSMNIRINGDLPTYSIPKPQKHPYKERYTVSSSTCSTIEMSITMTSLFTKHQSMWILTNSTDLDNFKKISSKFHLSKHFDFSTLYTTNPFNINHSHFFFLNGEQLYRFIVLGQGRKNTKCATQNMKPSVCWSCLSIKYLSNSEGTFFNKSSASPCKRTVPLSLPILLDRVYNFLLTGFH